MSTMTLTNCLALIGPHATLSSERLDIVIDNGVITAIRPAGSAEPEGKVIEAQQRLVTAGLINGHHHSHEHYHKGRYDNLPLELWMNYVRPLQPLPLTPRQVYLRTLIGAIEALQSGTTTLIDDLNVTPVLQPELVRAAYQAYEDIGIRALVGITLFDKPFFRGMPFVDEEFPKELLQEFDRIYSTPAEDLLSFAEELAATRHPQNHRVGYIVTPSAPQRCTEEFLLRTRDIADRFNLPIMTHVQETRLQVVTGKVLFGSTMIEYLAKLGFLKPQTTLIHGVWLNPKDIDILARSGVTIQHNPTSNLKLGSGLAPIRQLLDASVNVSLGSDGCGSIETMDMLKVVSVAALVHKLRDASYKHWIGAEEAWFAGTMGGAVAIGRGDDLGAVEVGRIADLCLYRLDCISFVPLNNPLRQLVYAAGCSALDMVLVNGEIVLSEGNLTRLDEAEILKEIAEEYAQLQPLLAQSEREVKKLHSSYERIYERCQRETIASDTYAARLPNS